MKKAYHYTACGLDNVFLSGIPRFKDDAGKWVVTLPNIRGFHKAIAKSILNDKGRMSGKGMRFLRTEMEMTQAALGKILHRSLLTIGRWERGESRIDPAADLLLRQCAAEALEIRLKLSASEMTRRYAPDAEQTDIHIDGSKSPRYKPLAA